MANGKEFTEEALLVDSGLPGLKEGGTIEDTIVPEPIATDATTSAAPNIPPEVVPVPEQPEPIEVDTIPAADQFVAETEIAPTIELDAITGADSSEAEDVIEEEDPLALIPEPDDIQMEEEPFDETTITTLMDDIVMRAQGIGPLIDADVKTLDFEPDISEGFVEGDPFDLPEIGDIGGLGSGGGTGSAEEFYKKTIKSSFFPFAQSAIARTDIDDPSQMNDLALQLMQVGGRMIANTASKVIPTWDLPVSEGGPPDSLRYSFVKRHTEALLQEIPGPNAEAKAALGATADMIWQSIVGGGDLLGVLQLEKARREGRLAGKDITAEKKNIEREFWSGFWGGGTPPEGFFKDIRDDPYTAVNTEGVIQKPGDWLHFGAFGLPGWKSPKSTAGKVARETLGFLLWNLSPTGWIADEAVGLGRLTESGRLAQRTGALVNMSLTEQAEAGFRHAVDIGFKGVKPFDVAIYKGGKGVGDWFKGMKGVKTAIESQWYKRLRRQIATLPSNMPLAEKIKQFRGQYYGHINVNEKQAITNVINPITRVARETKRSIGDVANELVEAVAFQRNPTDPRLQSAYQFMRYVSFRAQGAVRKSDNKTRGELFSAFSELNSLKEVWGKGGRTRKLREAGVELGEKRTFIEFLEATRVRTSNANRTNSTKETRSTLRRVTEELDIAEKKQKNLQQFVSSEGKMPPKVRAQIVNLRNKIRSLQRSSPAISQTEFNKAEVLSFLTKFKKNSWGSKFWGPKRKESLRDLRLRINAFGDGMTLEDFADAFKEAKIPGINTRTLLESVDIDPLKDISKTIRKEAYAVSRESFAESVDDLFAVSEQKLFEQDFGQGYFKSDTGADRLNQEITRLQEQMDVYQPHLGTADRTTTRILPGFDDNTGMDIPGERASVTFTGPEIEVEIKRRRAVIMTRLADQQLERDFGRAPKHYSRDGFVELSTIPGFEKFKGRQVPEEIAEAIETWATKAPDADAFVWGNTDNLYNRAMSWIKPGLLAYNPSYYLANIAGNVYNGWYAGVRNPLRHTDGWAMALAGGTRQEKRNIVTEFLSDKANKAIQSYDMNKLSFIDPKGKKWTRKMVYDTADEFGLFNMGRSTADVIRQGTREMAETLGDRAGEVLKDAVTGRKLLGFMSFLEDGSKLAIFRRELEKGATPARAADWAKKFLFDYGDLAPIDRKIKSAAWFWMWRRKNFALQTSQVIQRPMQVLGPTQKIIRQASPESLSPELVPLKRDVTPFILHNMFGMEDVEINQLRADFLPEWTEENLPIRIGDPEKIYAKEEFDNKGDSKLLGTFGSYFPVARWLPPSELTLLGNPERIFGDMLNPLFKVVSDFAKEVDPFKKKGSKHRIPRDPVIRLPGVTKDVELSPNIVRTMKEMDFEFSDTTVDENGEPIIVEENVKLFVPKPIANALRNIGTIRALQKFIGIYSEEELSAMRGVGRLGSVPGKTVGGINTDSTAGRLLAYLTGVNIRRFDLNQLMRRQIMTLEKEIKYMSSDIEKLLAIGQITEAESLIKARRALEEGAVPQMVKFQSEVDLMITVLQSNKASAKRQVIDERDDQESTRDKIDEIEQLQRTKRFIRSLQERQEGKR